MRKSIMTAILILGIVAMNSPGIPKGPLMNDTAKAAEKSGTVIERSTLGGGCFWCLEAVFEELKGVKSVASGYAGGAVKNPTYQEVCSGSTGHAEVVQIEYDAGVVSFDELLNVFFSIHDPTTLNRQGADVGTQYRSVIFYHDEGQRVAAENKIAEIESKKLVNSPVVTEVVPYEVFYEAEEYHQDYFKRNPEQGYCQAVVAPKLVKFRELFGDQLK
jgi:peptide-methionine (S)-S-oxide reductase